MTYRIVQYGSDGDMSRESNRVVSTGVHTLREARRIVRQELGLTRLRAERRWDGLGDEPGYPSVEAYHADMAVGGSGGYEIQRRRKCECSSCQCTHTATRLDETDAVCDACAEYTTDDGGQVVCSRSPRYDAARHARGED